MTGRSGGTDTDRHAPPAPDMAARGSAAGGHIIAADGAARSDGGGSGTRADGGSGAPRTGDRSGATGARRRDGPGGPGGLLAGVEAVSAAILGALMAALAGLSLARAVARYAFGTGWPWSGDVLVIVMLTLAWIGAGHLTLTRGHIAVDLWGDTRAGRIVRGLFLAAMGVGAAALIPAALRTVELYGAIELSALPGVAAAVKYVPVAVGLAYVALGAGVALIRGRP